MARKIETYGIAIDLKDLRETAKATTNYGDFSPAYDEVFYDRRTGELWSDYHYSLGQNEWTEYHSADIICIGKFVHHVTQQELMDCIKDKLDRIAEVEAFNAQFA